MMTGKEMKEIELIRDRMEKDNLKLRDIMRIPDTELKSGTDSHVLGQSNYMLLCMRSSPWVFTLLMYFTVISLAFNSAPIFIFGFIAAWSVCSFRKPVFQDVFAFSVCLILLVYQIVV